MDDNTKGSVNDLNSLINEIKLNKSLRVESLRAQPYLQVEYLNKQIVKIYPQEVDRYERSLEQEALRQYLADNTQDIEKYDNLKNEMKSKFFKIKHQSQYIRQNELEPIDLIKSYSVLLKDTKKVSNINPKKKSKTCFKNEAYDQISQILQKSDKMRVRNRSKFAGITQSQRQKKIEESMQIERKQILQVLTKRDFKFNRWQKLEDIPNKEKYSINFFNYQKMKNKQSIQKQLFERRVRKIQRPFQKFQHFLLSQVKFNEHQKSKLQTFFMKMRQEFRQAERKKKIFE